ncbi:MAG TPA: sugar phosphate isomerase/epimerase [Tepidisphaeraceae bacterium]|nr:sugar phosphate isomerase/epimerase [Tepidisphaeraceae bacterium]
MANAVLGAQLYTLREFLKTPADIAKSLQKVREIGYRTVQVSGLGPIDAKELKKILDGEGLKCVATHMPLDRMKNETAKVIEDHQLWGCQYTAVGGFFPKEATRQDWANFAKDYSDVARKLAAGGLELGYHNHSHELAHYDGQPALQILLDNFTRDVWMEIDTYWIQHGGGDPIAWINKVAGRIPCVHLKDMAITLQREQLMAEIGEGNMNWPGILEACKKAGTKWYLVEQDVCQRNPFESLAISYRNLKAMGLE